MSFERDFYEERRRKWRRSAFWRGIFATLGILAVLIAAAVYFDGGPRFGAHIAQINLNGVINDDQALDDALKAVEENDSAKALILRINSPGGTTVGSEAIYEQVRRIAKKKPVVAVLGEIAASGGYIAAISADHIIARGNTITGSIGVILEYPNVTDLLARLGVSMETVRSSELKAEGSPFRKTSPQGRAVEKLLIDDSYAWFRDLVARRRNLSGQNLNAVTDGRVFTGRIALKLGLIDEIGGPEKARAYLESLGRLKAGLPIDLYALEYKDSGFLAPLGKFLSQNSVLRLFSGTQGPRLYSQTN